MDAFKKNSSIEKIIIEKGRERRARRGRDRKDKGEKAQAKPAKEEESASKVTVIIKLKLLN